MNNSDQYDVAIIGGGPGGYVAGIRAVQLGLRACVVEKDALGGVCLNWGCIPSKNLLHQAELIASRRELESIGARIDMTTLDYAKVHKKSRQAASRLTKGVEFLLKKNKVEVVKATAVIASAGKLALSDGAEIQAKNIVVATGSRPFTLPGFEFDEERVLSSTGILAMQELPKSIVILGAGAIGCEFAHVMHAFGVHVTLVEMVDHILPLEDEETVTELEKSFRKRGIKVLTGTRALSLEKGPEGVTVALAGKNGEQQTVAAEKVLCVFGRTPNTDAIGLENVGLETAKGYIPVGDYCQTRVPGIFAIGDVVNTPLLAHVASKEGEIVVEYIAGHSPEPRIDVNQVPSAIYCEPQVAGFGLRENQARVQAVAYQKSVFPYRGVGKPVAVGKAEGMVKILYDPESTQILGGHIVGHGATELIHEVLLAKCAGLLPKDVASMIHAHPTVCEAIMEAMRGVAGQPIHM